MADPRDRPSGEARAAVRILGDDLSARVDRIGGKLVLAVPVAWERQGRDHRFAITPADLAIIRREPARRALLEVTLTRAIEGALGRGLDGLLDPVFDRTLADALHGPAAPPTDPRDRAFLAAVLARIAREPPLPAPPVGKNCGSALVASAVLLAVLVGGTVAAIVASARSSGLSPTIGRTVLATAAALAIFAAMAAAFGRARGRMSVRDTRPAGRSDVAPAPATVLAQDAASPSDAASEAAPVPSSAPVPTGAEVLFDALRSRSIGAGIAEGRGGYPGGDDAPGWTDYVAGERATLAAYDALVAVHGEPKPSTAAYFRSLRESLPDDERLSGEDDCAHVDLIGGRLQYSISVSPWQGVHVRHFPLRPDDVAVLRADPQRRATLEVLTRLLVEHRRPAGGFSELDFADLMRRVLHARPDGDAAFAVAAETGADVDGLIRAARVRLDRNAT